MEFIENNTKLAALMAPLALVSILIGIMLIIFAICYLVWKEPTKRSKIIVLGITPLVLALIATFVFIGFNVKPYEAIQNEIRATYGLSFTDSEIRDIAYPDERPTLPHEMFGTIEKSAIKDNGKMETTQVSLVWTNNEFILINTTDDNISFAEELERV